MLGMYTDIFSAIWPIVDNTMCKVMQVARSNVSSDQNLTTTSSHHNSSTGMPLILDLSAKLKSLSQPESSKHSPSSLEDRIIPLSQTVYEKIRLLQEIIPIDCKYNTNAVYKEFLLNVKSYLDRVSEGLSYKLPFGPTLDVLKAKGVVCINCEGLNNPRVCDSCKDLVDGTVGKVDGTSISKLVS